jgi:hypothetical protein
MDDLGVHGGKIRVAIVTRIFPPRRDMIFPVGRPLDG